MRFARFQQAEFTDTPLKRAAALRLLQRQRNTLPLFAPLIAEAQPSVDEMMACRAADWLPSQQDQRKRRADAWRAGRAKLSRHPPRIQAALLSYWNSHRWLPADPVYLLDMLQGFEVGRLVLDGDTIRPARVVISLAEARAELAHKAPQPVPLTP